MASKSYDYLIVGAGLFGSVFAHQMTKHGKKCLVIDKRPHSGGNVYCSNDYGINVHEYGAHIFHTNDEGIWNFVNQFVEFNNYINSPIANYNGELYNLPFNMNTFNQMWGVKTPIEAENKIKEQIKDLNISNPKNLEEQALKLVGTDIYEKLIKGYTEKQWGRKATDLPAFIIKRLPVRFTFNNNYFNDKYQGIPIGGYNKLIDGLLRNIEVKLNTDFFSHRKYFESIADKIVFTGKIDEYYNYRFGLLNYRSLNFKTRVEEIDNFQGVAVMNYTDSKTPFTRIIEHKHFEPENKVNNITVVTEEYPAEWNPRVEPYYPINDTENNNRYNLYKELSKDDDGVIFGGRLAEYKYYDMHQVIGSALSKSKKILEKEK